MRILLMLILCAAAGCKHQSSGHVNASSYIDTIIHGYAFSMTEDDFNLHTQQLLQAGVADVDKKGLIVFSFAGHPAAFSPSWDSAGKLAELGISIQGEHGRMLQADAYGKISEKYWNPEGWSESPGYLSGSTTFTYKEGNLQITVLEGIHDARVFYKNTAASQDSVAPNVSHSAL